MVSLLIDKVKDNVYMADLNCFSQQYNEVF